MEENVSAGIPVVEPIAAVVADIAPAVATVETTVTADAADVQSEVTADVADAEEAATTDAGEAEGFFSSVYDKIRAEVTHLEGDAVAFEEAVQTKIEAFVSGIKAKLQSLHSGS